MKQNLLLIIFLTIFSIGSAQLIPYKSMEVVLENGDTISSIKGKLKLKTLKYKLLNSKDKPKKIDFSEIRTIKRWDSAFTNVETLHFFQTRESEKYVHVKKIVEGEHLNVYGSSYSFSSAGAGGMTYYGSAIQYYVRKPNEDKVTYIGAYDAVLGEFKRRVYDYFSDCNQLLEALKDKRLRLRNGLEEIGVFYNNHCGK
ncbi:hypothetical protein NBT05_17215 [Aquimarina sp. ERC-38]|uniref:hypothetical protein n=1 Tax=Aquimarina sp. ERC-38 TaxID=2949996 RepID=UPI002245CB85|nr:hypothetical protein [Aquimarina sp. ERC-38]UZO80654.1 hypothetical protein NBT05_17145 [Aquimarina sp. ERC-38]UZO80668.1 hypothetical protein NBT05_17215 [Aquimarina sp. ERC-38]